MRNIQCNSVITIYNNGRTGLSEIIGFIPIERSKEIEPSDIVFFVTVRRWIDPKHDSRIRKFLIANIRQYGYTGYAVLATDHGNYTENTSYSWSEKPVY